MHITKHASRRVRKRNGIPKRAVETQARRAWDIGLKHSETKGNLRKYLDKKFLEYGTANQMRVHGYDLFIFRDQVLITVYPLPKGLHKIVDAIKAKKSEHEETPTHETY